MDNPKKPSHAAMRRVLLNNSPFLVLAFAILWGAMFLNESLTPHPVAGGLTVLAGDRPVDGKRAKGSRPSRRYCASLGC